MNLKLLVISYWFISEIPKGIKACSNNNTWMRDSKFNVSMSWGRLKVYPDFLPRDAYGRSSAGLRNVKTIYYKIPLFPGTMKRRIVMGLFVIPEILVNKSLKTQETLI